MAGSMLLVRAAQRRRSEHMATDAYHDDHRPDYDRGFVRGLYSYEDDVRELQRASRIERTPEWHRGFDAGRDLRNYHQR
jgi:hypothetical protein